jgi:hypothetical protein
MKPLKEWTDDELSTKLALLHGRHGYLDDADYNLARDITREQRLRYVARLSPSYGQ